MKKAIIIFLSLTACAAISYALTKEPKGTIEKKEFNIEDYSSIETLGSADVYYEQSPIAPPYLRVETDEDKIELINIEVKKGVLSIKLDKSVKNLRVLKIYTNSKSLSKVLLTGSGNIKLQGEIKTDKLDITLQGSGDINALNVNSQQINVLVKGSGDVVIKGKTKNLSVKVQGSGDFDGKALEAQDVDCIVQGSGDAVVNASSSLNARVQGSGDIKYLGAATKITKSINGSGDINKISK